MLEAINPAFLQPCTWPKKIPAGDQEPAIVFPILKRNQTNHEICAGRHGALIEAVKSRDAIQGAR